MVAADHPRTGGEPDAGALEVARGVQALKRAEQLVCILHVEAGAVVADEEAALTAVAALANLDPDNAATIAIALDGSRATRADGQILTASAMNAMNSFAHPDALVPTAFKGAKIDGGTLRAELPAKSVVVLELR